MGRTGGAGSPGMVLSAFMSPPRPRRDREEDQKGPSQHHPPRRVEAPEVRGPAGLRPEVVPAAFAAVGRIDRVSTIRTGQVVGRDDRSFPDWGVRGSRGKHECSPGWDLALRYPNVNECALAPG